MSSLTSIWTPHIPLAACLRVRGTQLASVPRPLRSQHVGPDDRSLAVEQSNRSVGSGCGIDRPRSPGLVPGPEDGGTARPAHLGLMLLGRALGLDGPRQDLRGLTDVLLHLLLRHLSFLPFWTSLHFPSTFRNTAPVPYFSVIWCLNFMPVPCATNVGTRRA